MSFEQDFADAERTAQAIERAGKEILKAAKQLEKAAQEGDIRKLRRAVASVAAAFDLARQETTNARSAWPYTEDQEQAHLERNYTAEFMAAAKRAGLTVHERDERLIAFPSIIRVLPGDRAVKVDRLRVTAIRPSHLAARLVAAQTRRPRSRSEQFIESLYAAYKMLVPRNDLGTVIKLANVYEAFTLQPGARAEYGKSEFARDIFVLDRSSVAQTRSGAKLSLPASTSAKGSERDRIQFVAPDGEVVSYYGLRFTEGKA